MKKGCRKYLAAFLAASALLTPWSTAFCASLSVQEAVDMAMEKNLLIKIQEKGEETARAVLKAARGDNSVSFSLSAGVTLSRNKGSDKTHTGKGGLTANMPIFNFGRNAANIDSGQLEVQSSYLKTFREMENVKLDVINAYYNVLEADKTVGVRKESVNNYQAHLTNVQQLFSAGKKAKIDVLRSSVELSNAKQSLLRAENDYAIKVSTLKNMLYMDQNEPLKLTEDFSYMEFRPGLENCIDYALGNRKDLLVQSNTLQQRILAVKSAKTGYWPSVNLTASTNGAHEFLLDRDNSHGYSVGIGISWNIFDSGVTQAAIDKAKAARDVAELTLKKDKNDIDLSVRKAYYNMREAEKRFSSTQAAVGQAQEDYFISREKYRAGEGLMLDIIDAQLALSTAKLNFISAQYDYARYKATVENEIGLSVNENVDTVLPVAVSASDKEYAAVNKAAAENLIPEQALPDADFTLHNEATAASVINNNGETSEEAVLATNTANEVE